MLSAEYVLILFYYELVLGFSAFGTGFASSIPSVLLTSLYAGLPVCFLLMAFRGRGRTAAEIIVRILTAVPFIIEFFIFMQFKSFYDINTVLFGGGDALTGFSDMIMSLVVSTSGIVHIILFLLPTVIYIIRVITGKLLARPIDKWKMGLLALLIPVAFFTNLGIISSNEALASVHGREYSFPAGPSQHDEARR